MNCRNWDNMGVNHVISNLILSLTFLKSCGFPGTRALIIGIIMETNGGFFFFHFQYFSIFLSLHIDTPEMRHRILYLGIATCQL